MTTRRTLLATAALLPLPALAQGAWPERPIRLVVPFPPGGLTDVLGRFVADVVGRGLPQPVVVENRPGGGYSYASPGIGTAHHLLMEMLKTRESLDIQHVPYQGSTTAVTDIIGGRMDGMWLDAAVALPQLQAGRLRALAVSGPQRHEPSPNVPTLSETHDGMTLQAWQAVVAPAGTPAAIVARLNAAVNAALNDGEMAGRLRQVGVTPTPMTPDALASLIASDAERWAALVRAAGIPPQ